MGISNSSSEAVEASFSDATPDATGVVREETVGEVGEAPGERSNTVLGDEVDGNVVTTAVDPGGKGSLDHQVHNCCTLLLRLNSKRTRSDTDDDAAFSLMLVIAVVHSNAESSSDVRGS